MSTSVPKPSNIQMLMSSFQSKLPHYEALIGSPCFDTRYPSSIQLRPTVAAHIRGETHREKWSFRSLPAGVGPGDGDLPTAVMVSSSDAALEKMSLTSSTLEFALPVFDIRT